ncbi:hypothetical protein GCM10027569_76230 [Flindersiella endophytica]
MSKLSESELHSLAAWIAGHNTDRASYVGYVGVETDQVLAELADLEAGAVVAHAVVSGVRVGLMMAEWDPTSIRVWLHGPWTDDEAVVLGELGFRLFHAMRAYRTAAPDCREQCCVGGQPHQLESTGPAALQQEQARDSRAEDD